MSLATPERIRSLQRKLYCTAKAKPAFRFYTLYDKICRADILAHAYEAACTNAGAPGVDGRTFEHIEDRVVQTAAKLVLELPLQATQCEQARYLTVLLWRCVWRTRGPASYARAQWTPAVGRTVTLVGKPDAGNQHVRLCVQRRLVCSAGDKPAGARVRSPVVWIAGWRETKTLKPIDKVSLGEITSHRAVTTVNANVASKVSETEGRARNRRAKAA
jgi:hypothetical protein